MEKWNVLGYRHSEFDTQDGKHIVGTTLYLARNSDRVNGTECCKLFASARVMDCPESDIMVGSTAVITYNRFGKPDCITFEDIG